MKMKKRILFFFMLAAIVLSLCGCKKSSSPDASEGETGSRGVMHTENQPQTKGQSETKGQSQTKGQSETKSQSQTKGQAETKSQSQTKGQSQTAQQPSKTIKESGSYTAKEDVALYLYTYHKLPENFITKKEANALGWSGGSLEKYAPGKCIGGDRFGNYEGRLPSGKTYYECDIDTLGASQRGAKRIVYTKDWDIYYTQDHYETFEKLY